MRKNPSTPFDDSGAIISWPIPGVSQEASFGFFYTSLHRLLQDYELAASWKHVSGVRATGCSLYLEKTTCGHSWFTLGPRHYSSVMRGKGRQAKSKTNIVEPRNQRIEIRVLTGGKNRRQVEKKTKACTTLWVVFACYDGNDPEGLSEAAKDLRAGRLGAAPGTEPVRLSGISIRGKLVRTRKEDCSTTNLRCE